MDSHTFIIAFLGLLLSSVANAEPILKRAALDDCLKTAGVPTAANGSSDYTQALKPFNQRVTFIPVAVAIPTSIKHIQDSVACGVANGVLVTPKSGGHSYGSHGLGGENGHLLVDMRNFSSVIVNQTAQTAVVGTAGRLGDVATALYSQGKQAIVHGTCPGVGVGGLTLHGGYGMISRLRGLSLDNILEAEIVLANSSVVTASTTQNPDLFYAIRGAGAAFGIVTNFKFKTFTAPESNIVFNYGVSISSAAQMVTVLTALQDFTRNTQPPELNMRLFISSFSTTFSGVYYGNRTEYDKLIQPLLTKMGIGDGQITTNTWLDTLTSFSNGPLAQTKPYNTQENFFAKSLMPDWLSPAAITALANYWDANARSNHRAWYLLIDAHGGNGSAITRIPDGDTSYAHRNATFKMQFYDRVYFGSYDPSYFSFLNGWIKAITDASPGVNFGMYINYADTSLTNDEAHRHYWLGHYDKLVGIKKVYDPKGIFKGPQLIGS